MSDKAKVETVNKGADAPASKLPIKAWAKGPGGKLVEVKPK
jgi:hypothetical protein